MDRAEAIKRLEWLRMAGDHVDSVTLGSEDMGYFDMAIAALREQERLARNSHDVARGACKWISVKERLPEDERSVLAYYGFGHNGTPDSGMMFTGVLSYFCFDPEPHWQHAGHGLVVTHWMPVPEPPGDPAGAAEADLIIT